MSGNSFLGTPRQNALALERIEYCAFNDCPNIKYLTLPSSITSIELTDHYDLDISKNGNVKYYRYKIKKITVDAEDSVAYKWAVEKGYGDKIEIK